MTDAGKRMGNPDQSGGDPHSPGGARPRAGDQLAALGTTVFFEMTQLAKRFDAVNLGQGFPDFPGPDFLKHAAVEAIDADHNQYAPMHGVPVLLEAIAADLKRRRDLTYDTNGEITVFAGATEAIHCALLALTGPGDGVVMLEPYYDSYLGCCAMSGATPRTITLEAPAFRWDEKQLADSFDQNTRVLLLNTPHNPTGRVLSREEMEVLAGLCVEHDALCVCDEVYDRLVYEGEHISMAQLPGMRERTVVINSTGKTFSLTGWKIGYATAPRQLMRTITAIHQYVTFAVATPFQHAMAAAIAAPNSYFDQLLDDYRKRRDFLVDALNDCGLSAMVPEGSYFVMADIRPLGFDDDVAFCRHLVENIGVAAVPPSALYTNKEKGQHLARFAFCKREETLEEAARRLRRLKS